MENYSKKVIEKEDNVLNDDNNVLKKNKVRINQDQTRNRKQ